MIIHGDPIKQLTKQLGAFFEISDEECAALNCVYSDVQKELIGCFKKINNKYYCKDNETFFNVYHVGQWTMFLYLMSKYIYLLYVDNLNAVIQDLSSKIYFLLKTISSADIFYQVKMPEIWFFDHPQGSVMGRAKYSNYFTFSQGCTVGNNKGKYPSFGEHVSMFSNSKVLGDCKIGDYVLVSANAYIKDTDIPSFSIVFGSSPNLVIKSITKEQFYEYTMSMFNYLNE